MGLYYGPQRGYDELQLYGSGLGGSGIGMRDDEDLGMRVECFGFRDWGLEASGFGKKGVGF